MAGLPDCVAVRTKPRPVIMDFRTASELSKRHPGSVVTRDDNGMFVLILQNGQIIHSESELRDAESETVEGRESSPENTDGAQRQLELKNQELKRQLRDSEARWEQHCSDISDELREKEAEARRLSIRVEELKDDLEKQLVYRQKLDDRQAEAEQAKDEADFLLSHYEKRFGKAKITYEKQKKTQQVICRACNGDGGIKGGCRTCDGKGWLDEVRVKSTPSVSFPEGED
jgi:vacuolar-type H+-ATPase subunit I/STV1